MQLFLALLTVEKLIRSNVLQFEIDAATRVARYNIETRDDSLKRSL